MNRSKNQGQDGFVAIIVAALIMVILALITIGFTRIMQREQRQAIDRQLSRQALYAAESGVNDVLAALKADTTGTYPNEKTTCDVSNASNNPAKNDGRIDGDNVAYTCVLYDKTPSELVYDASPTESKVIPLETQNSANFSSIDIAWGNSNTDNNDVDDLPGCGSAKDFPSSRSDTIPVLKIDLTSTSSYNRTALIGNTEYLYVAPCNSAGNSSHNFDSVSRGDVIVARCSGNSSQPCNIKITGLNSSNKYISRIKPIYASASIIMTAVDVSGNDVQFKDAQVSIDVTARASDVIRRLRVSVPFSGVVNPPESVFQAFDGVCKLLSVDRNGSPTSVPPIAPAVEDSCTYP